MELYVNSASRMVSIEVPVTPVTGSLDVSIFDNVGVLKHTVSTVTSTGSALSFTFPFFLSQSDGDYTVKWDFKYIEDTVEYDYTNETTVSVVTPILPLSEIAGILGVELSSDRIAITEAAVRTIIQAHTGQRFGFYKDRTLRVEAHGESALRLPERLIDVTGLSTLSATLEPTSTIITSDGWYLKKGWAHELTTISNTSTYWGSSAAGVPANNFLDEDLWTLPLPGEPGYEKTGHGQVISAPGSRNPTAWANDYPFAITGNWGHRSVPTPVREAARLLVNDYGCREAAYRDRYLESIKAADWRLQYSSRAWEATGNARADYLLSEYVILDWAVI
jgi:hypothetical protein